MISSRCLQEAIAVLRTCKNQESLIAQLKREQVEMGAQALNEMKIFTTEIDFGSLKEIAINAMQGKDILESLFAFIEISPILSAQYLEKYVLEIMKKDPLRYTAQRTIYSRSGKITGIIPPLLSAKDDDYILAMNEASYEQAKLYYHFFVYGSIMPALNILLSNCNVTSDVLADMIKNSLIIPASRKGLWIKGLLAGFRGEYDVAIHLLIPQFEHGLRSYLDGQGEIVWNIDLATGLHSEMSLNQLLDLATSKHVLGDDFNLKCLLIEKSGFNIRNEISHGLVEEAEFFSPSSIYVWWILLKIALELSNPSIVE